MKKKPSITIMFPFLNDWGTAGSLVALAIETAKKWTDDWEVIIVNDGSKKEDREALEMITRHEGPGRIRIIDHEKNRGYGGALRSGFAAANKDLIFYTDCDAQYDPREMTLLIEKMKPDIGLVNGYKIKRSDPPHRVIAGRIYHYLVKSFFGIPIRDTDCDFRLIRRKVFDKVKLFENTGTICTELVKKIDYHGYKIIEVPVHHFWRTSGKSQFFNFSRLYKTGTNLLKLWWKLIIKRQYEE
ncbi:glycosyl transferase [Candidatus Gottesmanbacteria bacterium RIFCSPHIGHO2_02_FULL_39_14]|uniref:Glycosyl transferase n=3 Tax=Candidatus Gottesmaniibacteriota TaxID=1752720 RepID=A0A1F5ZYQ6_9BACT|nr:MAG: glycosyl transferase [Candidatus Gottesmanbacteria bacterium RBG_16_38_7b]OGG17606.1 MAG: glycosyl transferase [Candidatus Gottesmanbacteria bacterium RIFCSPHIGHO2_02_FULL_39_14]OGG32459.1 MAG: glycosyl transferase [Candidatus Gottesmanbacteria bacterium RIFCSPLOWO2_02_FULL_38_8]